MNVLFQDVTPEEQAESLRKVKDDLAILYEVEVYPLSEVLERRPGDIASWAAGDIDAPDPELETVCVIAKHAIEGACFAYCARRPSTDDNPPLAATCLSAPLVEKLVALGGACISCLERYLDTFAAFKAAVIEAVIQPEKKATFVQTAQA